ncbi:restriction endonuclease subunit S [Vibrio metschnikovii]|nr:restriction endonuclease subunit S [Vibrio metschnikovii]
MSKTNSNPSGWVSSTLSKHIDLLTGFAFKSSEYKEQGIRLLRGDNVMQNNIRWDDAKFWDENSYEELSRYQLKEHDIVIALDRTWVKAGLKVSVIRKRDIPSLLVQRVARLRAKSTLNQSFLSYIVRSHRFEQMAKFSKTETAVPHISPSDIRNFKIELPSLLEQRNIAKILELWDNAIEKTEALIAAKEKQFEWLCTNLLSGRKKSFGFTGKSIPTAFGSIFSLFKKVNTSCADYEVLSVTKDGIVSQSEYFNKEVASKDKSKYLIADKDTLVMSGLNFWMGAIDFQTIRDTGIVSPAYKTFKVNEGPYNRDYLRFFIRSHYMTKILLDSSIQGASIVRRNLDMEWLSNSLIDLPNLEEQRDIANILSLAEKEIDGLKLLAEKYRSQKRGLMQKLLTGEWQVGSSQHLSEETYQEASA